MHAHPDIVYIDAQYLIHSWPSYTAEYCISVLADFYYDTLGSEEYYATSLCTSPLNVNCANQAWCSLYLNGTSYVSTYQDCRDDPMFPSLIMDDLLYAYPKAKAARPSPSPRRPSSFAPAPAPARAPSSSSSSSSRRPPPPPPPRPVFTPPSIPTLVCGWGRVYLGALSTIHSRCTIHLPQVPGQPLTPNLVFTPGRRLQDSWVSLESLEPNIVVPAGAVIEMPTASRAFSQDYYIITSVVTTELKCVSGECIKLLRSNK